MDPFIRKKLGGKELSLGADPEIFVFDTHGLVPAFQFLPEKEEPAMIADVAQAYWDGFQAEWRFTGETRSLNTLTDWTQATLRGLFGLVQEHKMEARPRLQNVVRISPEVLENAQDPHIELGCMPSWNAYGINGKGVPNPRKLEYRFAGGHMHFGEWRTKPKYEKIVKTLDATLGLWAVGAAQSFDNPIRREYYGLAGEYRKPRYGKGYGVEYRVLSNFFLAHPAIFQLTWEIGRQGVRLAESRYQNLLVAPEAEVIQAINTCDADLAKKLTNEPLLRWMLSQLGWKEDVVNKAIRVGYQGVESVVHDPDELAGNWLFNIPWSKNCGFPQAKWPTYARAYVR